jgi:hypothetical protein
MSIRQFNASYILAEDRILMRVTLESDEEYRFWLTRACLRGFFRQVDTWLVPPDDSTAAAVQAFQREAGLAQADYQSPLRPGERLPLGDAPVLVEAIDVDADDDSIHIAMALADKRQADFSITGDVLVGVHHLLEQAARVGDWGLLTTTFGGSPGSAPTLLH